MRLSKNSSLDLVASSVAGMRDGAGPLLAVFLIQEAALSPSALSWVMAAPGIASLCLSAPVGFFYDKIADRRRLLALGGALMLLASFLISLNPRFYLLFLAQALAGIAMPLLSCGIPALSLQLFGAAGFGPRLARNEVFSKLGNFVSLGITGFLTQRYGVEYMFPVIYCFAGLVIVTSLLVRAPALRAEDHQTSEENKPRAPSLHLRQVLKSRRFLMLVALTCLYFLSNSSMLFIFEQRFVPLHPNGGAGYISSALALTQAVIFVSSIYLARMRDLGNPLRYLLIGFFLMLVRGLLYAGDGSLPILAAGQLLDGMIAAIVIIVPTRALAVLNEKNFNLLSGSFGTFCSLGASASMVSAGYLIQGIGFEGAFLAFSGLALLGALVCLVELTTNAARGLRA